MNISEVRQKYLKFFKERNHNIIPSASLVPQNDPTTLFTGSGMQPLVPYLLGQNHPEGDKLTNSQKCFRAEDIEEVGDNRHTTFFEMLGNWSLGDYFKKDQLTWIFQFMTEELGISPEKLYVTVFAGDETNNIPKDEESAEIWKKLFREKGIEAKDVELGTLSKASQEGMLDGRIFYYGSEKNWWSRAGKPEYMPAGEPGGPDSEIFYDFGTPHDSKFGKECHPNCDCGRFLEIGNSVFMEYKKEEDGSFSPLPQKNVDFGGGLERLVAAVNDNPDIFEIDVFQHIVAAGEKKYRWDYKNSDEDSKKRMRIIADHIRSAVFLTADGVIPSNTMQGYVLRRLLRRAIFSAQTLSGGFTNIYAAVASVTSFYPELEKKRQQIQRVIVDEEEKFWKTLETGKKELDKLIKRGNVTGRDAFILFTTYGYPFELTKEVALQAEISVNEEEFNAEMAQHQEVSRAGAEQKFKGGLADSSETVVKLHTATHLMNAALRKILGDHVRQKGSNITNERTRFDFTHADKLTPQQIKDVEDLVNSWIQSDLKVKREEMSREEAEKLGAIGVFGEKYPDTVSIYSIVDPKSGDVISREFCGGPHADNTGELGTFKIQKEESSSAGVRRIKATLS